MKKGINNYFDCYPSGDTYLVKPGRKQYWSRIVQNRGLEEKGGGENRDRKIDK